MGMIGTAYGCIFCPVGGESHPAFRSRVEQNQEAVRALPKTDRYPPLTRNMFAITAAAYPGPGLYKIQMVHFGLSLKDAQEEWDVWLRKLEQLLGSMYWERAELRLELDGPIGEPSQSRFDFRWEATPDVVTPGTTPPPEPPNVAFPSRGSWHRTGKLPYSASWERCRAWIPEAENELAGRPDDMELMERLLYAYHRMGDDNKAGALGQKLRTLDPARAQRLERL